MALVQITLIEITQLATPTAMVLVGGTLILNGQTLLGILILLLALPLYLLVWCIWAKATKTVAHAQVKKEKIKLKRTVLSANATERKHQLEQEARKERFGYGVLKRLIRG